MQGSREDAVGSVLASNKWHVSLEDRSDTTTQQERTIDHLSRGVGMHPSAPYRGPAVSHFHSPALPPAQKKKKNDQF